MRKLLLLLVNDGCASASHCIYIGVKFGEDSSGHGGEGKAMRNFVFQESGLHILARIPDGNQT